MDDTTRGVGRDTTRGYAADDLTPETTARPGASRSRTRSTKTAATGASSELDPETERKTREIQAEIQHTREEMAETVEALQERLQPSNVIAQATDRVKHATSEKVRSMADSASDTAQGMMKETRRSAADVVEGVRQNPIPALMIGAGVAWLLMDKSRNRDAGRNYSGASGYRSSGFRSSGYSRDDSEADYRDVDYPRTGGADTSYGESTSIRARSAVEGGLEAARRTTYRTQTQLQRMMRDNPLLVGAAAVVVGAAVGAALPETERENELMGEARDSVVNRAQDAARNAASTVQNVAKDAAGEVAERVVTGRTTE